MYSLSPWLHGSMAFDLMGTSFDYVCLSSVGASGGIVVAWRHDVWLVSSQTCRSHSVSARVASARSLTAVYGPVDDNLKPAFLDELHAVRAAGQDPLLVCGDFNLIYQAADKSNDRLNRRSMRRFRRALDDTQLDELYLHGRLYTWSNERRRPTLEHIDRAFASADWLELFPNHHLRCLSSDCSDHAPLLLQLQTEPWAKPRWRSGCTLRGSRRRSSKPGTAPSPMSMLAGLSISS